MELAPVPQPRLASSMAQPAVPYRTSPSHPAESSRAAAGLEQGGCSPAADPTRPSEPARRMPDIPCCYSCRLLVSERDKPRFVFKSWQFFF